jgi:hypothetical protein
LNNQPADLWQLSDLATPWSIHVVATLDIARHIDDGHAGLADLAEVANCDPDMLGYVMRLLISRGLFLEPEPGVFALNEAAMPLLDESARLGLNLDRFGGRMVHAWSTLLELVRTGKPAYRDRFGLPFWEDLDAHAEIRADFDALIGPAGHGIPDPAILPDEGSWESIKSIVDVGGGSGALLVEILRARPGLTGTVVDLPDTAARALDRIKEAGLEDRATVSAQSFFDPLPTGADLYILKSILNDWPDEETLQILRRCAEAAGAKGKIAILGGVTPDERPGILTIEMVLIGGKTRTVSNFSIFIRELGLVVEHAEPAANGRFVVVCRNQGVED